MYWDLIQVCVYLKITDAISLPPVLSWHYPLIILRPRGLCNSFANLATLKIFDWHMTLILTHKRVRSWHNWTLLTCCVHNASHAYWVDSSAVICCCCCWPRLLATTHVQLHCHEHDYADCTLNSLLMLTTTDVAQLCNKNTQHCNKNTQHCNSTHIPLTLSSPVVSNGYISQCLGQYCSNPPFQFFDIRALWRSGLIARVPKCQKIKKGGLGQCGA